MQSIRKKLLGKASKLALPRQFEDGHPANLSDYENGAFCQVEIQKIHPDPNQPRKYFDPEGLEELAASIRQKGVLQPVIIRRDGAGEIHLVAGERRLRSAKMAGLTKIPAMLTKDNPAEIAIIENLQRKDLSPIEEAEAFGQMIDQHHYTQEQLGAVVGKARSTIAETLGLNRLPEEIKAECRRADTYPRRLLVEIAKQKNPMAMLSLFNEIKAGNLKSGDVRKITRKTTDKFPRSLVAVTLNRMAAIGKNLQKVDVAGLGLEEREQLKAEIQKLRALLDQLAL